MGNAMQGSEYYYTQGGKTEVVLSGGKAQCFPWHMHMQHWTCGVVLAGTVLLGQAQEEHTFGPGQHFILPPCVPHSVTLDSQAQMLTMCIPRGSKPDEVGQTLGWLLQQACSIRGMHIDAGYEQRLQVLLEQSVFRSAAVESSQKKAHRPCIAGAVAEAIGQRMLEAPEQLLSLAHMAKEAGYSPWHFVRMFHRYMGVTPHALLTLCRVRKVRQALRAHATGAEAAASAGFTDQSHMLRVFKQYHNMTPGQFAKANVKIV